MKFQPSWPATVTVYPPDFMTNWFTVVADDGVRAHWAYVSVEVVRDSDADVPTFERLVVSALDADWREIRAARRARVRRKGGRRNRWRAVR